MNLNYSDEQNMLREQVLKFCETNYDFTDREKILDSEVGYSNTLGSDHHREKKEDFRLTANIFTFRCRQQCFLKVFVKERRKLMIFAKKINGKG